MLNFTRAWSCWCAWCDETWPEHASLHGWNPRLRNFWIPSVVWDYSAVISKSCQCLWLYQGRFTQGHNSWDQERSQNFRHERTEVLWDQEWSGFSFSVGGFYVQIMSLLDPKNRTMKPDKLFSLLNCMVSTVHRLRALFNAWFSFDCFGLSLAGSTTLPNFFFFK